MIDGDFDRHNGVSITSVTLRRLLNITFAYLVREVPPKDIKEMTDRLNGTYVPKPGEDPPPHTGLEVTQRDLDALDSLKAHTNPPTM